MLAARSLLRRAAAVAVFATALVAPAAAGASCPGASADPNAASLQTIRGATLCLLNGERRAHGLRPLRENDRLDAASQRHADDMARHHFFAHGDFLGRIRAARYLAGTRGYTVGENIAWGTQSLASPAGIVQTWMNSPPHRENILRSSFREIGLGVAPGAPVADMGDGATYATDFGARL